MSITGTLILPADVMIVPISQLPDRLRRQVGAVRGEFAVTRAGTRAPSVLVNEPTAKLLERFRRPSSIVDAVREEAGTSLRREEALLRGAFPMLAFCYRQEILVRAARGASAPIGPMLANGQTIGRYDIISNVRALSDSEVYRARDRRTGRHVALKIARSGTTRRIAHDLEHEARLLRALDGTSNVTLSAIGRANGRAYLATHWCRGHDVADLAASYRSLPEQEGRRKLLALCASVLRAYAHVQAQGVLHCDVQSANIVVSRDGTIRLLDFGMAARIGVGDAGASGRTERSGVIESLEPEWVSALLTKAPLPELTFAGEQYAVASLVYSLIVGRPYLDFDLREDAAHRQIVERPPLTFAQRGLSAWPALEFILAKALSKSPSRRYASMAEFAEAFELLRLPRRAAPGPRRWSLSVLMGVLPTPDSSIATLWARPSGGVQMGAAGGALALLHAAVATNRAELLAAADVWAARAAAEAFSKTAFTDPANGIRPQLLGRGSLHHGRPGVYCAQALVAQALGHQRLQIEATSAFLAITSGSFKQYDFTLGTASIVHGCAMLLFTDDDIPARVTKQLRAHGDAHLAALWARTDPARELTKQPTVRTSGMAHGWAGILYASLTWGLVTGRRPKAQVLERLEELSDLGRPMGRGSVWPTKVLPTHGMAHVASHSGWCAGSAGFVQLWTLAFDVTGDARYLRLAEQAGITAGQLGGSAIDLCCGAAGRAYSLLTLYRHTGASSWLRRAKQLVARATMFARSAPRDFRLYKGALGVALLDLDLERPENARMPFVELDGRHR